MEQQLKEINEKFLELKNKNISHEELGIVNDFSQGEDIKNQIVDRICEIIALSLKLSNIQENTTLKNSFGNIQSIYKKLNQIILNIEKIVEQGVNNQQFPNLRQNILNNLNSLNTSFKDQLYPLEQEIKLDEVYSTFLEDSDLGNIKKKLKEIISEISDSKKESERLLAKMKDELTKKGVSNSASLFSTLSLNFKKKERNWFVLFILSTLASFGILIYAIISSPENIKPDYINLIYIFIKKIILFIPSSIIMKISLKKYNIERNLRIIYEHRANVLNQYDNIEEGIENDITLKTQLRIEMMKYIYADPKTGYLDENKSNDLSVNPMINLVENISKKAVN